MNTGSGHSRNPDGDADQALRELFARAAPREAPPPEDTEEIRRSVYAEWDAVTGRRVLLRRVGGTAVAAALVGAVLFWTIDTGPPPIGPAVAHVERLQGTVRVSSSGGGNAPLRSGETVAEGSTLTTGSGRVALRLVSGGSLRLAPETRITLTAADTAELDAGLLYFDSEGYDRNGEQFVVVTALGTLRDVGTQYLARLEAARFSVGVRDGSVSLARGAERAAAAAGEKLTVAESAAAIRREPIAIFGEEWVWAERLAPPFDIDGRQLVDFLQWEAAQTGRTLAFADPAVERIARETVLSGSIDLEPQAKLVAVLALTDLDYSLDGGRLLIVAK